ncbi:uncharacterized protein si:dkey-19b23.7 isoform X2 [Phycodurus eques]|uniref:uncharacterized protein si:dkey-19b23.7 isoform X2 n=1 Tax=Phycodurus eques TaxID=693459 RepID=UPI002ACEBF31|nr:uncharacterized protein si:dkey-19b23.7 isoform X2 [Phycodurus eques]
MKIWAGAPRASLCREPPPAADPAAVAAIVPRPAAAPPAWPAGPAPLCPQSRHSGRWPLRHALPGEDPSSEEHLLPASPSEREMAVPEVNCTLFLLAGYVKYGRPHAWIRSNHERLVGVRGTDSVVRDTPMKLKSITDWQTGGSRVWDMVSELVSVCTVPFPSNPFALDMRYIRSLPVPERFLATGALLNFLETYAVCGNRDELHYDKVLEEVKPLRRLHVQTLLELQRLKKTPAEPDPSVED